MKYELVIFDLDGTLIDTIDDLGNAVNHAMESRGFAAHSMKEYRAMVGHGVRNLVAAAMPEAFRTEIMIDECLSDFVSFYRENIDRKSRPYKGMQKLLSELSGAGVRLAVASNKFQAGTEILVKRFFGDVPFVAVCGNREGFPLKPDPELISHIFKVAFPEGGEHSVVLVGDSDTDMKTAMNAGIPSVAVTWGFRSVDELTAAGATIFARTASELKGIIF